MFVDRRDVLQAGSVSHRADGRIPGPERPAAPRPNPASGLNPAPGPRQVSVSAANPWWTLIHPHLQTAESGASEVPVRGGGSGASRLPIWELPTSLRAVHVTLCSLRERCWSGCSLHL